MSEKGPRRRRKKGNQMKIQVRELFSNNEFFAYSLPLTLGTWRLMKEFICLFLKAQHLKLWFSVSLFAIDIFSSWLNHWVWRNEVISTLLTDLTASCKILLVFLSQFVETRECQNIVLLQFPKLSLNDFCLRLLFFHHFICLIWIPKALMRLFIMIVEDSLFRSLNWTSL